MRALIFLLAIYPSLIFSASVIVHPSGGIDHVYIVNVFDSAQLIPVMIDATSHGAVMIERLEMFDAFVASMSPQVVNIVKENPRVWYIEQDMNSTVASVPWGLDRLDQRNLPLDGAYNHSLLGQDVTVYIVDTGIQFNHPALAGRASSLVGDGSDCHGHGTHLAGIVHDIADPIIKSVRVIGCDGNGTASQLMSGLQSIVYDLTTSKKVVLIAVSFPDTSTLVDRAVRKIIDYGCVVVVAAGNSNMDACTTSPSNVRGAIRVGATTPSDARAAFSNHGSCVTLFAPGSAIESAWLGNSSSIESGTSMAAAHVAGVAALVLHQFVIDGSILPATYVENKLVASATNGIISSTVYGSPNLLLYSNPDGSDFLL